MCLFKKVCIHVGRSGGVRSKIEEQLIAILSAGKYSSDFNAKKNRVRSSIGSGDILRRVKQGWSIFYTKNLMKIMANPRHIMGKFSQKIVIQSIEMPIYARKVYIFSKVKY